MKVIVKNTEVELKKTFRSYIVYEAIMGSTFEGKNLTEFITYFYSVILSSAKNLSFTFDEYLDWIDDNAEILSEFIAWLADLSKMEKQFIDDKTEETDGTPLKKK